MRPHFPAWRIVPPCVADCIQKSFVVDSDLGEKTY
jgi:hypothetical protein